MLPIPSTMVPPSQKRPNSYMGGIIQICVTRACDKACFGCTQGSNLAGRKDAMTPEQFERAVASLHNYFGIVACFGGNPTVSKHFDAYCKILQANVPKKRCGLWCNKLFGKGAICRETFNPHYSNLNVHLDREAYDEFKRDWPESRPFGLDRDSRHSPPFVAMMDVMDDEAEIMDLIGKCDINQNWSALIGVFRGELRAWFCEIAGAQAMMHQDEPDYPDTGVPVVPGWWESPMSAYEHQVRWHCFRCGIPLRGYGELAQGDGVEQVSKTHAGVFKPKVKGREVQLVTLRSQLNESAQEVTDYMGKGQ